MSVPGETFAGTEQAAPAIAGDRGVNYPALVVCSFGGRSMIQ